MSNVGKAKRRKWADLAVLVAAIYALVFAIWAPEATAPNTATSEVSGKGTWYFAHMLGGILPLAGYFVALKSSMAGKVLVGLGAGALLAGLAGFDEIGGIALRNIILPAVIMLVALPFFGRMPTPEDEGRQR